MFWRLRYVYEILEYDLSSKKIFSIIETKSKHTLLKNNNSLRLGNFDDFLNGKNSFLSLNYFLYLNGIQNCKVKK